MLSEKSITMGRLAALGAFILIQGLLIARPASALPACKQYGTVKECCWHEKGYAATGGSPAGRASCNPGTGTETDNLDCFCAPIKGSDISTAPQTTETQKENDPIIFKPGVSIPGSDYTSGKGVVIDNSTASLLKYIMAIIKYSTGVIGIIAAIALMLGGITWMTAAGNQEKIGSAKTMISSSLAGLSLAFLSFTVLSMVNTNLVAFKVRPITNVSNDKMQLTGCCQKENQNGQINAEHLNEKECEAIRPQYKTTVYFSPTEGQLIDNKCIGLRCCQISTPAGTTYENTTREKCKELNPTNPNNFNYELDKKATDDKKGCYLLNTTAPVNEPNGCLALNAWGCREKSDCCSGFCIAGYPQGQKCESCIPRGPNRCASDSECCPGLRCSPQGHTCS